MSKKDETPFGEDQSIEPVFDVPTFDLNSKPIELKKVMDEILPEGRKVKTEEIVNKTVTIHYMRAVEGDNGPFLWCILTDENGELLNTAIGGKVIAPKLWAARNLLPILFKLVWVEQGQFGGYYDYEH